MSEKIKTPTISVIMPVYNAERYLRESIDSILRQTYTDFEFIIINDGSSDASWDIIDTYAKKDSRIVAINQENAGVVKTANYAASIARGTYLARTDADDVSFDTKLEDLMDTAIAHPEAIVIVGSIEVIDENDEFVYRELVPVYNEDIKRALYVRNPIPNGATLVKKTAFEKAGGFADVFAEDCHLWSRLWFMGEFRGTGTTVYRWRMNSTGLTFTNNEKSIQKEKEYLGAIWARQSPSHISRKEILDRSSAYFYATGRFSIDYKLTFLTDLCRVAAHQIKHGQIKDGALQLLMVASTGRTGTKIAFRRISLILGARKNKVLSVLSRQRPSETIATHEEGLVDRSKLPTRRP